jgi:hypothetical protein
VQKSEKVTNNIAGPCVVDIDVCTAYFLTIYVQKYFWIFYVIKGVGLQWWEDADFLVFIRNGENFAYFFRKMPKLRKS